MKRWRQIPHGVKRIWGPHPASKSSWCQASAGQSVRKERNAHRPPGHPRPEKKGCCGCGCAAKCWRQSLVHEVFLQSYIAHRVFAFSCTLGNSTQLALCAATKCKCTRNGTHDYIAAVCKPVLLPCCPSRRHIWKPKQFGIRGSIDPAALCRLILLFQQAGEVPLTLPRQVL